MIPTTIQELSQIIDLATSHLKLIDEQTYTHKESPEKWSKKEILGHLIDSASNNHRRFLLAQFEVNPIIFYDQDKWCKYNHYQVAETQQLIDLWNALNKQLVHLWTNLTDEDFQRRANDQTLAFLAADYNSHLAHHLNQITGYNYN